jgi:hypothetical protein
MSESVTVVAGGHTDRDEKCEACGHGMFYFLAVGTMFCGNMGCAEVLKSLPIPAKATP